MHLTLEKIMYSVAQQNYVKNFDLIWMVNGVFKSELSELLLYN